MKRWIWTASLSALLGLVAADWASAQTRTAADGPWAGWAQCEVTAQFNGPGQTYVNQQTHTWMLTGTTPTSGTDIKVYPATWTVTGGGSSQRDQGAGRTTTDKWVTTGRSLPDTLTFRVDASGVLHISSPAGLRSTDAINGTRVAQSTNGNAPAQTTAIAMYVDEWQPFPDIQDVATKTVIAEAGAPRATTGTIAPGPAPPGTSTTVACSWNFARGGAVPPPPGSSSQQTGLKPGGPVVTVPGGVVVAGPSQPTTTVLALPGGTATAGPVQPTTTALALPGGVVAAGPSPSPSGATGTISATGPTLNGGAIAVNRSPTGTLTAFTYPDPTGFRADQIDDGTVKLTWNAATGVSTYMVGGPGTNNGLQVTGTTYTVKGISAGTQTWSIASLPVVTPFDKWPTATASVVSPFSGVAAAPVSATTTTPGRQAFTTSGTFTVPNGVTRVTVELWGAGAGGAGAPPIGHGGGGGAYTRIVMAVSQGASLRIVMGGGGAGGVAMNGADGSSTQLMLQGNVLAEADGGKGDGTGGRKSSASGVVALAGLDGKPPQPIYYPSDGSIYAYSAGPGGGAVTGSVSPVGTTGGRGGYSQQVCYDLYLSNCGYENYPGGAGLGGYALISY